MLVNGTTYDEKTPRGVVTALEEARRCGRRLKLTLGDPTTGRAWGDVDCGYIGRSWGPVKVPLRLPTRRSTGGEAILTACIIRIEYANKRKGGVLWECKHG